MRHVNLGGDEMVVTNIGILVNGNTLLCLCGSMMAV